MAEASAPPPAPDEPHALTPDVLARRLRSDVAAGLTMQEAKARFNEDGPNEIAGVEGFSAVHALRAQVVDPLVLLLLGAAALAATLAEVLDAIMIVTIVALNIALGFIQEWRAERALAALSAMMAPSCTVVRNKRRIGIPARELVAGDLCLLSRGARVPADLKLTQTEALMLDESPLTGEARAMAKAAGADVLGAPLHDRASMAYAGSVVLDGKGAGLVIAVGADTAFGQVAALAGAVERRATPLQKRLSRLSWRLGLGAAAAAVLVSLMGYALGRPPMTMVLTGVSLAVAAVPEGLPAVVALSLALGVRAMARRNALVRRLRAAEALGSATVICTDKTGTLTTGEMTAVRAVTAGGETDLLQDSARPDPLLARALRTAGWCNDARSTEDGMEGEPTESALLGAARRWGVVGHDPPERLAEEPFSPVRKRMLVVVEHDGRQEAHIKGAPDYILPVCSRIAAATGDASLDEAQRAAWIAKAERMGEEGLRVIALASRAAGADAHPDPEALGTDLVFLALIGLMDPPRPRARPAVAAAHAAGVRIVMITGDAAGTAKAVADAVGLKAETVLGGHEIDALDDSALLARLKHDPILSRATPAQKLRVVQLLQSAGEIVAMTGDGVNDAPALKQADIGVAMGIRGVDAAKAAADLILLDDDFGTIVDAIREGRRQDESLRNFTRFLIAHNVGEVLTVAASAAWSAPLALTPVQLLWINLVTDGPMALALGVERAGAGLMDRAPRRPGAPVLDGPGLGLVVAFGLVVALSATAAFHWMLPFGVEAARTAAFTAIVVFAVAMALSFRSLDRPLVELGVFSNSALLVACLLTLATQAAVVNMPATQTAMGLTTLSILQWAVIAGGAGLLLLIVELIKIIRRSFKRRAA
jgi:Ca2+-transporting ATPase